MTTFLLIRHGLTDTVGHRLAGRTPGVHLNDIGRQQAAALPGRLHSWKIDAIYSSPLERTRETAAAVAEPLGLPVALDPAFAEFDFGDWTGLSIAALDQREDWRAFCRFRGSTRAPGGELITEVQTRMVTGLASAARKHPGQTVAVFSHADAIKATLMHFLDIPPDNIHRLEVFPASINVLRLETWGAVVLGINLSQ